MASAERDGELEGSAAVHGQRLSRLRECLRAQGVDGFWLPRTDVHGSEYLPASEERVAWLTGFTGSAAVVVILGDRAAIFTDGRYTLQVRREVDAGLFEIAHLVERPPWCWLADRLEPGMRIGYDPFLVTRGERRQFLRACRRRGAELVPLRENPVDRIWEDRPAPPCRPAFAHPLTFAGRTSAEKRRRVGEQMAARGAEWLLITAADAVCWLLNVRGGDIPFNPLVLSFVLLHRSGRCRWFVDRRKLSPELSLDEDVSVEPYEAFRSAVAAVAKEKAAILADPALVRAGFLDLVTSAGGEVIDEADPVMRAKAVKNPVEIAGARRAHQRDGQALVRFLAWLEEVPLDGSVDEWAVVQRLETERRRFPEYRGASFDTIAGWGPNGAIVHYRVTPESSRPLVADSLLLVDSGGHYVDGTTDVTRTVALGQPTAEMRRRFTEVLKGHIALARARFPTDTTGTQLDTLARLPLWQQGHDYDHGTGHGVGSYLCVHEGPVRIAKRSGTVPLEAGMILSNEPGYYREGAYGIRIENLVLVQPAPTPSGGERPLLGFETLTLAPIDRRLIEPLELDAEERAWIDSYHARVRQSLVEDLDPARREWLCRACAPL